MASFSGSVENEPSSERHVESSQLRPGQYSDSRGVSPTSPTASGETSSLANNVLAAISMAEVIRSTLGPRGLDKLLVDQLGNRVVTNDGYTVLVSMKVVHPISRFLVEIAERQQFSVGDGTTSAVLMAAEMLKEGYRAIVEHKIHPMKVISQIDDAVKLVVTHLTSSTTPIQSLTNPLIKDVVQTALASKLDGSQLSAIIMQALELLNQKGRTDLRHGVILLRRLGEDLLIEGVAIEHLPRETSFVESFHLPKVVLVKGRKFLDMRGVRVLQIAAETQCTK